MYPGSILLHGRFSNAALIELAKRDDIVGIGQPFISVSVSDMRGIAETPTLQWDSGSIGFLPGSRRDPCRSRRRGCDGSGELPLLPVADAARNVVIPCRPRRHLQLRLDGLDLATPEV